MKKIFILLSMFFIILAYANDAHKEEEHGHEEHAHEEHAHEEDAHDADENEDHHDHHDSGKAIGVGKAIVEVSEEKGFKLSLEAFNTLKIELKKIKTKQFSIGKTSLVTSKNEVGFYLYRNEFFRFVKIDLNKKDGLNYIVTLKDFLQEDQIVIKGVELLRIADVYSTDQSEYGHSH